MEASKPPELSKHALHDDLCGVQHRDLRPESAASKDGRECDDDSFYLDACFQPTPGLSQFQIEYIKPVVVIPDQ